MKRLPVSLALLSAAGISLWAVRILPSEHAAHSIVVPGGNTVRSTVQFDPAEAYRRIARCADVAKAGVDRRQLAGRWIEFDPRGALEFACHLDDRKERDPFVRDLLHAWALRAPNEALDWCAEIQDSVERQSARSAVCLAVAEEDPRRAVELALEHRADEDDGAALLECLAMQWSGKEPDAALEWASDQPIGPWRDRLVSRSAWVLSKTDPAAAAGWVAGMQPGPLQQEACISIIHQWALQDVEAAGQWAEGFPDSLLRERALGEISGIRRQRDAGVRGQ